jgi:hypothetical protein
MPTLPHFEWPTKSCQSADANDRPTHLRYFRFRAILVALASEM